MILEKGHLDSNEDDKLEDSELILQVMETRELIEDATTVEELNGIERENQRKAFTSSVRRRLSV